MLLWSQIKDRGEVNIMATITNQRLEAYRVAEECKGNAALLAGRVQCISPLSYGVEVSVYRFDDGSVIVHVEMFRIKRALGHRHKRKEGVIAHVKHLFNRFTMDAKTTPGEIVTTEDINKCLVEARRENKVSE